jgi:hypothetical protein
MNNTLSLRSPSHTGRRGIPTRLLALIAFLLCLAAQSASAQWQVVDNDANSKLSDIKDNTHNTDTNTANIAKYLQLSGTQSQPGTRVEDPKQAFKTLTIDQDDAQCQQLAPAQLTVCQELAETQNAEYMYMVLMYNTSNTRNDQLKALLDERNKLQQATDYGKLEDNTNKLTALYTLIALDHQQLEATTYAYQTRIHYLEVQQGQIAQAAMSGTKAPTSNGSGGFSIGGFDFSDLTSIGTSIASGAALKVALDVAKSPTPSGMQTLGITSSNGF